MSIEFDSRSSPLNFLGSDSPDDLDSFLEHYPFLKTPSPLMGEDDFTKHGSSLATPPISLPKENLKKRKPPTQDDTSSLTEARKFPRAIPENLPLHNSLEKTAFVYFSVVKDLSPESDPCELYRYAQNALNKAYPTSYRKKRHLREYVYNFVNRNTSKGILKPYKEYVSGEELEKIKTICHEILSECPLLARADNLGKTAFVYFSAFSDLSPTSTKSENYSYTYNALSKAYPQFYPTRRKVYRLINNFINKQKAKGVLKTYEKYVLSEELEKIKALCLTIIPKASLVRPANLEQTAFVYFSVVKHLSPESRPCELYTYAQNAIEKTYPDFYPKDRLFRNYIYSFVNRKTSKGILKPYQEYVSGEELEKIKTTCRETIIKYSKTS